MQKANSAQNAGAQCTPLRVRRYNTRLLFFLQRCRGAHCAPVELLQSRLRRARPSAFRLPASRTAGGKLHALEEGARGNNDYNSLSHGYAVPAPSKRELFFSVRSSYTRNKTSLFEERLKSAPPVAESADENAEGWLPKADGRRVNPHLRDSKRRLFLVKKPMQPIKNTQHR